MDDSLLPVTSLRENLTQTHLDFSYFRTTEQNSPGLMQFANHKTAISPLAGELIAQQTSIWRAMLDDVRVKQQISIFD